MSANEQSPNHRLAAVMREAGVSNKGLARRMQVLSRQDGRAPVSPSHTTIAKYLNGTIKRPTDRACRVIVAVLSGQLGRPLTLEAIGYGDVAPDGADTTLHYPTTVADSVTALTQLAGHELRLSDERAQLHVVPAAWAELLVKATYGTDGSTARPLSPRDLTEVEVQAVLDATEMFATFDYRYGGGQPKPLVARFLETSVLPTIPHVSTDSAIGRAYFSAVAALTRLAGWTAYDTGQHGLAQRYLYQAFRLARAAGDKALCGRILAGMSHQANFLGHFEQAVYLARAAAGGAQGHATPTAMALFHAMEARALASQGDESATTSALAAAEKWLSEQQSDRDPNWIKYFDHAELDAEYAHCYRELEKPDLANEHATASISASENLYVRSLSFVRTVLATSHLQAGEHESALVIVKGVIDTAAHLTSGRVMAYLNEFRDRLIALPSDDMLHEFDAHVSATISEGLPLARTTTAAG